MDEEIIIQNALTAHCGQNHDNKPAENMFTYNLKTLSRKKIKKRTLLFFPTICLSHCVALPRG